MTRVMSTRSCLHSSLIPPPPPSPSPLNSAPTTWIHLARLKIPAPAPPLPRGMWAACSFALDGPVRIPPPTTSTKRTRQGASPLIRGVWAQPPTSSKHRTDPTEPAHPPFQRDVRLDGGSEKNKEGAGRTRRGGGREML